MLSVITYLVIENPIRHSKALRRIRWASIGLGAGLIAVTLGAIGLQSSLAGADIQTNTTTPAAAAKGSRDTRLVQLPTVLHDVEASDRIKSVPALLVPPLSEILSNPGAYLGFPPSGCTPTGSQFTVPSCIFGDPGGSHTMVLYGDSHAGMWFTAINNIAIRARWRLVVLFKEGCPAALLSSLPRGASTGEWIACNQWHQFVTKRLRQINPNLLIVSETSYRDSNGVPYSVAQLTRGLGQLFAEATTNRTRKVFIGSPAIPSSAGPDCLARHINDVKACSGAPGRGYVAFNAIQRIAAESNRASYINVVPWFCARRCSSIVDNYDVYVASDHVTVGYSLALEGVLAKALRIRTH